MTVPLDSEIYLLLEPKSRAGRIRTLKTVRNMLGLEDEFPTPEEWRSEPPAPRHDNKISESAFPDPRQLMEDAAPGLLAAAEKREKGQAS